jgi:hypothetical protein
MHADFLRASKGGFFLMKKLLERVLSVYTTENAIASRICSQSALRELRLNVGRDDLDVALCCSHGVNRLLAADYRDVINASLRSRRDFSGRGVWTIPPL